LARFHDFLAGSPQSSAAFGSYDDSPAEKNFVSQFKNLFHHYIHQTSSENAWTFWTGCGAIRREIFLRLGGFDASAYPHPSIEDIDLGYRLKATGGVIRLLKSAQVKHLKKWTFASLLRTDILDRGVPWTRLLLKTRSFRADLNLQTHNRWSVFLVWSAVLSALATIRFPPAGWALAILLLAIAWLNRRLYAFFADRRGLGFAVRAALLHWLYYFYNGIAFLLGILSYLFRQGWGGQTIL
jgi:GT2 family glycosyltransferase